MKFIFTVLVIIGLAIFLSYPYLKKLWKAEKPEGPAKPDEIVQGGKFWSWVALIAIGYVIYVSIMMVKNILSGETLTVGEVILAVIDGCLFVMILESIRMPGTMRIEGVKRLGKPYTLIANVEGKRLNKPDWQFDKNHRPWSLLDLKEEYEDKNGGKRKYKRTFSEKWNIYFFLYPVFKMHRFPWTYTKSKKIGQEVKGDTIVWKNEDTKEMVVSRTGTTHFVLFRAEYPTITTSLDTAELAPIHVYSNNILEAVNVWLMLFSINDWFGTTNEVLNGSLKGLVASKKLEELNRYSSEEKLLFNEQMKKSNEKGTDGEGHTGHPQHPGLLDFGVMLYKSVFKDWEPASNSTKLLMESYSNVSIAEQEAKVYAIEQEPIVKWRKKWLVDTGLAKVNSEGNIIELVPDANVRISAEAVKELSKLKGTLVLGDDITKMLNIPTTPNPTITKKIKTTGGVVV